jgi:transposase
MSKPLPEMSLSSEERDGLYRVIRKSTSPQHWALRARIVLLAEKRLSTEAIMKELNTSRNTVVKWRKRFCKDRLDGLKDEQRPGKPRTHDAAVRLKIATDACRPPETITHWSTRELAQHLYEQGIKVSHMTVQRVLSAEKIKPHLCKYWLNSTDPDFEAKQTEIVGLYLNPPENALVVSVDERTGIQALGRKYPNKPMEKGSPEKMEFEYKRHGTVSLIASLSVHFGEVMGKCYDRHTNNEFIDFLEEINHRYGRKKEIHLIVDNLSVHKHSNVKGWLTRHPNYHIHFTPTHASWLNQIELWFSIYGRKIIKRGVSACALHADRFSSKEDLVAKTLEFIELYNKKAKPFRWTYTGDPLTI